MKKLLLLLFTSHALMADTLPSIITTTVKSIDKNNHIQLASSGLKGMNGIVVHEYGNKLSAITHSVIVQEGNQAKIVDYTDIPHENIPNIQTDVQVGDKVILGAFYNNAMVLAPDAKTYAKITNMYKKTWIHPDAYALDFMMNQQSAINLDNLETFAKANQVGLILIADKDNLLILDPLSKKFLGQTAFSSETSTAMSPFFARFKQLDVSIFGISDIVYTPYYQAIKEL